MSHIRPTLTMYVLIKNRCDVILRNNVDNKQQFNIFKAIKYINIGITFIPDLICSFYFEVFVIFVGKFSEAHQTIIHAEHS